MTAWEVSLVDGGRNLVNLKLESELKGSNHDVANFKNWYDALLICIGQ
jgi:hypothetical protein